MVASCRFFISMAIRSPTRVFSREFRHDELKKLFEGYGYKPYFVEGHEPDEDASRDGRNPRLSRQ